MSRIKQRGFNYPNGFVRSASVFEAVKQFEQHQLDLQQSYALAGRIMLKRIMGKALFLTIVDDGHSIQLYCSMNEVGDDLYSEIKEYDIGDIIGVEGGLFKTKTNELTLRIVTATLLSKNLLPLPDKFHGLSNVEMRYRQRYLDLIMNTEVRDTFVNRSRTLKYIRDIMEKNGYIEVETPMMHPIPGGATAQPFVTHHNALDMTLFLRIAPELYLKMLIIGGFNKVFEINRNFRNEGISSRHNPEFTMLEFYNAYGTCESMMDFTEQLVRDTICHVRLEANIQHVEQIIDIGQPFARLTILDALLKFNVEYTKEMLLDGVWLHNELVKFNVVPVAESVPMLQLELFEITTEHKLIEPTFIIGYPIEASPLARAFDKDQHLAERFELFIASRELANGYSELNDPIEQERRFVEQAKALLERGGCTLDKSYITAMKYAMPPTSGCGIGIDRLIMLIADAPSIRDVILFPTLRIEDVNGNS